MFRDLGGKQAFERPRLVQPLDLVSSSSCLTTCTCRVCLTSSFDMLYTIKLQWMDLRVQSLLVLTAVIYSQTIRAERGRQGTIARIGS
jgi:hypothetical protein